MKDLTQENSKGLVIWDTIAFTLVEIHMPNADREKWGRVGYPRATVLGHTYHYIPLEGRYYIGASDPEKTS